MSDLIDRQAALDALGEEPPVWYDGDDEIAERNQWRRDKAAIEAVPPACNESKQQATDSSDCISRQDAIDAIMSEPPDAHYPSWYADILKELPSTQPRKKGKWIYGEKSGQDGWYCSECGGFIPWYYDYYGLDNIDFIEDFKTCPFCDSKMVSYTGADMREGEEG